MKIEQTNWAENIIHERVGKRNIIMFSTSMSLTGLHSSKLLLAFRTANIAGGGVSELGVSEGEINVGNFGLCKTLTFLTNWREPK